VIALGDLLVGYDTGVVSGALLFLENQFGGLTSASTSWRSPAGPLSMDCSAR
jgi:hypothetical protein